MSEEPGYDNDNIRTALLESIAVAKERIRIGTANVQKRVELEKELKFLQQRQKMHLETFQHMLRIYKNLQKYVEDRKELSMEMLQEAVHKAGLIVPDADVKGLHLAFSNKSARVLTETGQDVNQREGGAFRAALGILMRYALLSFQAGKCQVMFLDESFSAMIDSTADTMREYINAFKDDMLIVGIEQRSYLYEGIDREIYEASKDAKGLTVIRKLSDGGVE